MQGGFYHRSEAHADYSLENLKLLLERVVDSITLGELPKKVLITKFDLKDGTVDPPRWKPKIFHNYASSNGDEDQRLVDVVLGSVAAPVYFPTYGKFSDGGVAANNPSTCSLAQAYHEGFRDVRLLSLGTGFNPKFVDEQDADWGLIQWGLSLVNIFMEGVNEVADYQCKQILSEDYFRVQLFLPFPISLDEWQFTNELIAIADSVDLDPLLDWFDDRF